MASATARSGDSRESGEWSSFDPVALTPILQAALGAFTESGYHGASVRGIADRVGVTVPTLYYHHGSKEGLLLALLSASMADLLQRTDEALAAAGSDPVDRFVDFVDCTVRFMCYRHQLARLDAESRYLTSEARSAYAAPRKTVELRALSVLEDAIAAGAFACEYPRDVNRALLGTFQSIANWYRPDGALSPELIALRHITFALNAVRARESARSRGMRRVKERIRV